MISRHRPAQASDFFCQHLLQHRLVQAQVRHQALQLLVLLLELAQFSELGWTEAAILLLPPDVVASDTPILRHTSATGIPRSPWRSANAICSSVNFDFFIASPSQKTGQSACWKTRIQNGRISRGRVTSLPVTMETVVCPL